MKDSDKTAEEIKDPLLRSYQLPTETLPALELSDHLDDLIEFRDFIEKRGIRTRNTRIERYIEYLKHATSKGVFDGSDVFKNSNDGPFKSPIDWLLYVLREAHELMWILKGLKAYTPAGIDEKLHIIVSGRDFAVLDVDSRSRNTQFELRIASYFCQTGCQVNLSSKTDLIAYAKEQVFYFECKRIGAINQLGKRLSEAKEQLLGRIPSRNGSRTAIGCIAVDVTKIAFTHNGLTLGLTNEHSKDVVREKLIHIASDMAKQTDFHKYLNINLWLQIHISTLIDHPPIPATRFSSYHIFRQELSRKDRRSNKVFKEIFEKASHADDNRTIPAKKLTPRTIITVPKGATFNFDRALLAEHLKSGVVKERAWDTKVGKLTIEGKTHEFYFYEFEMVLERNIMNQIFLPENPIAAGLQLLLEMYMQRYPYEESEM